MKKIKLNSKLNLKKEQIANLNGVKGGNGIKSDLNSINIECPPTVPETCAYTCTQPTYVKPCTQMNPELCTW